MSVVVYRVTAKTVKLTNGSKANVVLFAYQPGCGRPGESDDQRFVRSGCAASDRMVRSGKLTGLLVHGRKVNGKIVVEPGSPVYQNKIDRGAFYDDVLGNPEKLPVVPDVTIPGKITYTAGVVLDGSQRRVWTHPNGTQMPANFIPPVDEVPEFYKEEVRLAHSFADEGLSTQAA